MQLLYSEPDNPHKIYGDAMNAPLVYCIYCEHKDYKAKGREDGLIYLTGFRTKIQCWEHYFNFYSHKNEKNRL